MVGLKEHQRAYIPHTPGAIERPSLLAQLSGALEHKLTVISAPTGYGKTTVVSQFVHQVPYPVVWHTVEPRERDVPNLHAHALAAIEQVAPDIQPTPEAQNYAPGELAAFVADYLRDATDSEIVYVLDDAHHLAGSTAAEMWLRQLIALLPYNCHMILISRTVLRLPYAEMMARGEVLALGQGELRFSVAEAIDLAYRMSGRKPSEEEARRLVERLEGWPAGIVLALQPLPPDLEEAMLGGGGPEALFEGLALSMLHSQQPALRDFLLASSTLRRLTPELCASALGLRNSSRWLAEAQVRNLFLSRISGGLVYHSLFRAFLQDQLQRRDPQRFVDLHARAARWLEEQGDLEEAFEHYITAQMPERAAALAERVAGAYFSQGKLETLLDWNLRLAGSGIPHPRLQYMCARIYIDRYEYDRAATELHAAEEAFRAQGDEIGIGEVQLQRLVIKLQGGQYQQAAQQASQLVEILPDTANLRARALRILGMGLVFLGDVETGIRCLEEALPYYRADGDLSALSHLLQDLHIAYTRLGRLDDVGACLHEYVALRRSLGGAAALALALNNLGYYYHQRGDYLQARATFQEGLRTIARFSDRRAESYLLWSLGDLLRDLFNYEEAARLYTRALELLGDGEPLLRLSILISTSVMRRWQGDPQEARTLAEEAAEIAQAHNMALETLIAQAAMWTAQAEIKHPSEAARALQQMVDAFMRQGARYELIGLHGVRARIALLTGDEANAESALDAALALAREVGSSQPLAAEVAHTPPLESFVLARRPKYQTLIRDVNRLREAGQQLLEPLQLGDQAIAERTYSLRVWTFDRELVERDGYPIPASKWQAVAAKELFFYLLFNGPATFPQISLVFWPDSSPQRVRSNFHTTLYRARYAVGKDAIILDAESELYAINPELDVWCDALQFEALVREARLLPPRDARAEDLWRKAVELYRGDFLPTIDMDWVYPRREALREVYLEALVSLSECARVRNDFREALAALYRAVEVDPLHENAHRAIMICYAQMGEKSRVRAHLDQLTNLFRTELGIDPSPETIRLANMLLG